MTYFGVKSLLFWVFYILFPNTFIEKNTTKKGRKKKIKTF